MGIVQLKTALLINTLIMLVIWSLKPAFCFNEMSGKRREFGMGYTRDKEKRTLFDITMVTILVSFMTFWGCFKL